MTFMNNRGQLIELKQFANVFLSSGPTKLERRDRIGVVYVNGQTLAGRLVHYAGIQNKNRGRPTSHRSFTFIPWYGKDAR